MIRSRVWLATPGKPGVAGSIFLFMWSLALVILAPASRTWVAALLALFAALAFYPGAIRRALRLRWLLLMGLMALPSLFIPGPPAPVLGDLEVLGLPGLGALSAVGLQTAQRTVLRAFVILVAVDGLTSSVDVSQIAALFERAGFQGLGFALGVALNLLPILRETTTVSWQSLRMRGGLRRQPLRGMRYFLVTVTSSALRRAADIALAAEARAYAPGKQRPAPRDTSPLDRPLMIVASILLVLLLVLP
jgi:energy-coupling factor transporter transmembrane protein EcfT